VLDIPLLFEVGLDFLVDKIVVVACREDLQIDRLTRRDKLSLDEAKKRISSQMSLNEKKKRADYVINNDGTPHDAKQQVRIVWNDLLSLRYKP
jgi:dephospho-CoA kinase